MWCYGIVNDVWNAIESPYQYDNHALCEVNGDSVGIFGGFMGDRLSRVLYKYEYQHNKYTVLSSTNGPSAREGCSLNYIKGRYFVFGGTDNIQKLGDLWVFTEKSSLWSRVRDK